MSHRSQWCTVRINSTNGLSSTHKSETRKYAISQWHSYKSIKSLTHHHNGLWHTVHINSTNGLSHSKTMNSITYHSEQFTLIQWTNITWKKAIELHITNITPTYMAKDYTKSTPKSWLLAFNRSNTRSDPQVQYVPLRPNFYFIDNSLTPRSG